MSKSRLRHKEQRALWKWRESLKELMNRYEKKPLYPERETLGYKP